MSIPKDEVTVLQRPIEEAATDLVKTVDRILNIQLEAQSQSLFAHGSMMVSAAAKLVEAVAMLHLPPPPKIIAHPSWEPISGVLEPE